MRKFTARYTHNPGGLWTVQLLEETGVISQGRTIAEARKHVREALAAWLDDDEAALAAELRDDVVLPRSARTHIARHARARTAASHAREAAETEQAAAVRHLLEEVGLSLADTGALLGMTRQRVHQIVRSSATGRETSRGRGGRRHRA